MGDITSRDKIQLLLHQLRALITKLVLGLVLLILFIVLGPLILTKADAPGSLPLPLHSLNEADYTSNLKNHVIPGVDIRIVEDLLNELFPEDPSIASRVNDVYDALLTPVFTSTPRVDETLLIPTQTEPAIIYPSPTPTMQNTVTLPAGPSPTASLSPSPTTTASASKTVVYIWPTATQTQSPTATRTASPTITNTPRVNHAPVISGPSVQTIAADALYSFHPITSDLDGDSLTFSITNKPSWTIFNTSDGSLSGAPTNANTGTTTVTINVSDGSLSASLSFSLTVTYTNHPPTITGQQTQTVPADSLYAFTPIASDPDGDALTFTISGQPAWTTFDPSTGALTGTPSNADVGTSVISITVSDGSMSSSLVFTLEAIHTNHPPIITGQLLQIVAADSLYAFTPNASDPDGDVLTFSVSGQPSWTTFDPSTGALTGTPSNADVGTSVISITVSDGFLSASLVFSLEVTYTNHAPTITGANEQTVVVNRIYSFTPVVADPDGDILSYQLSGQPAWIMFDSLDGTLSGIPQAADVGTSNMVITISDGEHSAAFAFTLTVIASNHPPVISGDLVHTVEADQGYTFTPLASDPDGDILLFSIDVLPGWATFNTVDGTLSGVPGIGDIGTTSITITVTDGALSASFSFDLIITSLNRAPVIDGPTVQSVIVGNPYTFTPSASDPDGDVLSFSIINQPAWTSFDYLTGTIAGTPSDTDRGTNIVIIRVSDGYLSADLVITLSVIDGPISPVCAPVTSGDFLANPSGDTYIEMRNPTRVNGDDFRLRVRVDSDDTNYALLKFDISSIPDDALISGAYLYLDERTHREGQVTQLHRLTRDWDESSASWNNASAGNPWSIPGGDFDPELYAAFYPNVNCIFQLDITSLVQGWVSGLFPNHGLILISSGIEGEVQYSAREDPDPGLRPVLRIDY